MAVGVEIEERIGLIIEILGFVSDGRFAPD
jgi:hypothetical protein